MKIDLCLQRVVTLAVGLATLRLVIGFLSSNGVGAL